MQDFPYRKILIDIYCYLIHLFTAVKGLPSDLFRRNHSRYVILAFRVKQTLLIYVLALRSQQSTPLSSTTAIVNPIAQRVILTLLYEQGILRPQYAGVVQW